MINTKDLIGYYGQRIWDNIEAIFFPMVLFFIPVKGILITVAAFVLLDTCTGLWKIYKQKTPFTSRGLSALGSKLLLYESVILCSYLVDAFILGDVLFGMFSIENMITKIASVIFLTVEVISINENYKAISGISLLKTLKNLLTRAKEIKSDITDITR